MNQGHLAVGCRDSLVAVWNPTHKLNTLVRRMAPDLIVHPEGGVSHKYVAAAIRARPVRLGPSGGTIDR